MFGELAASVPMSTDRSKTPLSRVFRALFTLLTNVSLLYAQQVCCDYLIHSVQQNTEIQHSAALGIAAVV